MAAVGEILSSSITEMVAACWQDEDEQRKAPHSVPRFGSFMRVDSSEQNLRIFAVVYDVLTGPQDSLHKPAALRMSRQELRLQQPQIFSLLRTEMKAAVVGYEQEGVYSAGLAPLPVQVHDFVYFAAAAEVKSVTDSMEFVRLLTRVSSVPNDELVVSAIWEAYAARKNDYQFLVEAGRSLSQAFGDDYNRLTAALNKLQARQSR
jgi:hypothetical protein